MPKIGYKHSDEAKIKISLGKKGKYINEKSHKWAGDNVGLHGVHKWVRRICGKPMSCSNPKCRGISKRYEWANKNHLYKRKKEDYINLCASCHRKYDIRNNKYSTWGNRKKFMVKYKGVMIALIDLAKKNGINPKKTYRRIKENRWEVERALIN